MTREEIIAELRAAIARVEQTFSALSDQQLQVRVHPGDRGWTAQDVLAHLAGRKQGYDLAVGIADGTAGSQAVGAFDADEWNQARVDERRGRNRAELLAEFRAVHEELISRVSAMPAELLGRPIPLGQRPLPLGDILRLSGGAHSINHAATVERALGLDEPPPVGSVA